MKLLSRDSNTKLIKTAKGESEPVVLAGLSLMPTIELCPSAMNADCFNDCLKSSGLAQVYTSVNKARQAKTEYYMNDREGFLKDLRRELTNLVKYADNRISHQYIFMITPNAPIDWTKRRQTMI
jgi:hypothetical protein